MLRRGRWGVGAKVRWSGGLQPDWTLLSVTICVKVAFQLVARRFGRMSVMVISEFAYAMNSNRLPGAPAAAPAASDAGTR